MPKNPYCSYQFSSLNFLDQGLLTFLRITSCFLGNSALLGSDRMNYNFRNSFKSYVRKCKIMGKRIILTYSHFIRRSKQSPSSCWVITYYAILDPEATRMVWTFPFLFFIRYKILMCTTSTFLITYKMWPLYGSFASYQLDAWPDVANKKWSHKISKLLSGLDITCETLIAFTCVLQLCIICCSAARRNTAESLVLCSVTISIIAIIQWRMCK